MSGGTGMAGLVVTALVSALVAAGIATLLAADPKERAAPAERPAPAADVSDRIRRLEGQLAELRDIRSPAPSAAPAAPGAPGAAPGAAPGGTSASADGPLPANRAELVALIDERVKAGVPVGLAGMPAVPERKRMSIDEAGAEIGLTMLEIDAVKRAYREAENEMLNSIMGTTDLEAIKEEVKAAKDDPDRKAALVNKCVGNVIRNLGHVMTIEDRRDREIKKFLPEEQMKKLKGYDLKPTFDDADLESVLNDVFND